MPSAQRFRARGELSTGRISDDLDLKDQIQDLYDAQQTDRYGGHTGSGPAVREILEIQREGEHKRSVILLGREPNALGLINGMAKPNPFTVKGVVDAGSISDAEPGHMGYIHQATGGEMKLYVGVDRAWPSAQGTGFNMYGHRYSDDDNVERYSVTLSQLEDGVDEEDFERRGEIPPPWARTSQWGYGADEVRPGNDINPDILDAARFFMAKRPDLLNAGW